MELVQQNDCLRGVACL